MIHPESIYRYRRHVAPDGNKGTRWDLVCYEGAECPPILKTLKRDGARIIYHGLNTLNHKMGIWRGKEGADNGWVSEVFQPDIKKPALGFGDLGGRANAALLIRRDEQADTITIMVFPGLGNQGAVLFQQWTSGGVLDSIPSNNIPLPTESVQTNPE